MLKPELNEEKAESPSEGGVQPYQQPYRWVMLALVSLLYFCFGALSAAISPLITPILADLRISYSQMGIILPLVLVIIFLIVKPKGLFGHD